VKRYTGEERQAEIMRLTKAAVEAAQVGQWDLVMKCYQDRGVLLEAAAAPVSEANDLLKLDEEIRDRLNTAQAVLTALLGEAAATRQRLQGLRRRLGVRSSSAPETVSMEA
jgi:enoyl-CoA hydratase/carnithine racemase